MTELLVHPYRRLDERQVDEFYATLSTCPNLEWVAPTLSIADAAARLQAAHRMRTPDALQAATAIQAGASGMITNDSVFERVKRFETLVLEELRGDSSTE
jgi:predicted nucleic acid-binding protein